MARVKRIPMFFRLFFMKLFVKPPVLPSGFRHHGSAWHSTASPEKADRRTAFRDRGRPSEKSVGRQFVRQVVGRCPRGWWLEEGE